MTETVDPQPHRRLGPRPLPVYLATAATTWMSSAAGFASLKIGSPPWKADKTNPLQAEMNRLLEDLHAADRAREATAPDSAKSAVDPFSAALAAAAVERMNELLAGVIAYRAHPYRREVTQPDIFWQDGTTKLLDYGANTSRPKKRPILAVPSLINRYYIMDLAEDRSLMRHLADEGHRTFCVDWDRPGEAEKNFDLTAYIAGRLDKALNAVLDETGEPPVLLGYCMGGLLALALACRRQRDLAGLTLLATPYDFSVDAPPSVAALPMSRPGLEVMMNAAGMLPTDTIQTLFHSLDPFLVVRKFLKFAEMDAESAPAEEFVALEDWLNDGVPLAVPVAREALFGWYGENTPANGAWRVAGEVVDPTTVTLPSLVVVPSKDRIVPPGSARALAAALPDATEVTLPLGHIGMMASRRAAERAWPVLDKWLEEV